MAIYEIQLVDKKTGRTRGYKFVKASSPTAIKLKPSRHVGIGVRIGKIFGCSAKTIKGAIRINAIQHGYRHINDEIDYGYPKQETKGGSFSIEGFS